jgi:glycosyltransferase involved in cell wall biosynthesis
MKHLSIIIPLYNVEQYVGRCLESLENQDIDKDQYEIICINDGSPDKSRDVVITMQKQFDNIILIDQENQGVSRARNNGMNKAQGKYLLFIDPDDLVESNCLNRVLKKADDNNLQVLFLGYRVISDENKTMQEVFNENDSNDIIGGLDAYFRARGNGRNDPDRMWAVLFRNDFLKQNSLQFLPNIPFLEDGEFISRILCLTNRCSFEGQSFYLRTIRPGSATHSDLFYKQKSIDGFILAAINLKDFQNSSILNEYQKNFVNQPIAKFVLLAMNASLQKPYMKNFKKIKRKLINAGFKKLRLKGVVRPYSRMAILYNYFSVYYLFLAYYRESRQIIKRILNQY